MFRASNLKETTGKARVAARHTKMSLQADENGLRPSDSHIGVCKYSEAARTTGVRPIAPPASGDDTTSPKTGKRHVEPTHSSNNEATRRVEGRIGVRKAWNASTQLSSRRTWGTEEDSRSSPPPATHATSAKVSSTHTAEQKAERSLLKFANDRPEMKAQIDKARADGTLVNLCAQVERQKRVQETQSHRDPMNMSPLKKSTDLGENTTTRPPFAIEKQDVAPPAKGHKRTFDTDAMQHQRLEDAARKERMRNGVYRHSETGRPLPYDTNNGEAAYPEPPTFGHSVPFNARHMGKARPDAMRTDGSSADADTLSIQRAAARAQRSGVVPHASNPQDFIFGNIPPPSPSKNRSLAEQHETKYAANNDRPPTGGKGRNERAYAKTSLW